MPCQHFVSGHGSVADLHDTDRSLRLRGRLRFRHPLSAPRMLPGAALPCAALYRQPVSVPSTGKGLGPASGPSIDRGPGPWGLLRDGLLDENKVHGCHNAQPASWGVEQPGLFDLSVGLSVSLTSSPPWQEIGLASAAAQTSAPYSKSTNHALRTANDEIPDKVADQGLAASASSR